MCSNLFAFTKKSIKSLFSLPCWVSLFLWGLNAESRVPGCRKTQTLDPPPGTPQGSYQSFGGPCSPTFQPFSSGEAREGTRERWGEGAEVKWKGMLSGAVPPHSAEDPWRTCLLRADNGDVCTHALPRYRSCLWGTAWTHQLLKPNGRIRHLFSSHS